MPCVVVDDLDPRVVKHGVVLLAEVRRDHSRDKRLDFTDDDALHPRVKHERACGDAGAESHHQHRPRPRVHERREVCEQTLEAHIVHLGRRLDFAADVKVADPAFGFRHGNRRVQPLARIQVARALEHRELPAVRDQVRRHGRADAQSRYGRLSTKPTTTTSPCSATASATAITAASLRRSRQTRRTASTPSGR